jgi:acetyl esterase
MHRTSRVFAVPLLVVLMLSVAPAGRADATKPASVLVDADVSYGPNPAQRVDVFVPSRSTANGATIVLIHGGGWVGGDKSDLEPEARRLARLGYVVASLNYRLAPRHPFPAAIRDTAAAVDWLMAPTRAARFGIDRRRIGVVGYSAGGQLAAMLATTDQRLAATVSLSGVYDFSTYDEAATFLGCDPLACPLRARAASPIQHVQRETRPLLLVSSQDDPIVSAGQLTEMDAALDQVDAPHVSVVVPGDGHATTLPTDAWKAMTAFLAASLGVPIPTR